METLAELIQKHNQPERAKQEGSVYQVWNDGEITLQKSGALLNQRNLHTIKAGDSYKAVDRTLFSNHDKRNGFIYTDDIGAEAVSKAILGGC